ncbi:zinc finger mym-type protein 1, partial [Lasius niger]
MSDGRKRLSGYQYRKIGHEKRKKEDELLEETKTLHTFFRPIIQGNEKNIDKPILEAEAHVQTTTGSEVCSTSNTTSESEQLEKQKIPLSKLTTEDANGLGSLATEGFRDWSNVNKILSWHENSKEHLQCQIALIQRNRTEGRVDSGLCRNVKNEIEYWRNVLKRVIVAVKALASRDLPFRGSSERFGSLKNGNFMMILETIAEFDPFLSTHIAQCGNPGSGKTSYLSSTTCNEFINLIASKVKN